MQREFGTDLFLSARAGSVFDRTGDGCMYQRDLRRQAEHWAIVGGGWGLSISWFVRGTMGGEAGFS